MPVGRREWHETGTGIPFTYPPTEKDQGPNFISRLVCGRPNRVGRSEICADAHILTWEREEVQKGRSADVPGACDRIHSPRLPKWSESSKGSQATSGDYPKRLHQMFQQNTDISKSTAKS